MPKPLPDMVKAFLRMI